VAGVTFSKNDLLPRLGSYSRQALALTCPSYELNVVAYFYTDSSPK